MILLGLDPGLGTTGWGLIRAEGNRLSHIANGQIATDNKAHLAARLHHLHDAVFAVIGAYAPDVAAVEEVFVNKNPHSTLKLAQARGSVLAACGRGSIPVFEHAATLVKKSVVGTGAADKTQVQAMLRVLLPTAKVQGADAADALAVAIAHAHLGKH